MGPIIPSTETQESCQISPCRLCAVPQAQHPRFRTSHASPPLLCHDQAAQLTTHTLSHQRAIGGDVVPEAFDWQAPASVLLRLAPSDCRVASPPITPAQWMRRDTMHVQSSFDVCALRSHVPSPCSAFSPRRTHGTTGASPCPLPCYSLHTFLRPTKHCHRVLSAPILLPQPVFSSHSGRLSVHTSLVFLCSCALCGSIHTAPYNSSHSCLAGSYLEGGERQNKMVIGIFGMDEHAKKFMKNGYKDDEVKRRHRLSKA